MTALRQLSAICLAAVVAACTDSPSGLVRSQHSPRQGPYKPRTRVYYVAAENGHWNYAPLGTDPVFGRALPEPWGVQTVYPKRHYVQYTDGSFATPVPQPQ